MNISYDTPRKQKSKFGYLAYLGAGVRDFFRPLDRYDVDYEIDGIKYKGKYTLGIVSNANRIAGVKNFYKDVKLDDSKFEVLLCKTHKKDKFLKSLVDIGLNDPSKAKGFDFFKTDNFKITFNNKLRHPWTVDGEKFICSANTYEIEMTHMQFRLSKDAAKRNCTK
jgi:diacylglycerol kinase family enzyme